MESPLAIDTSRNGWQDGIDNATAQRRGRRGYQP